MTIKSTIATIRAMSPRLSCRWSAEYREYRVALDGSEASAYYTADAEDAIGTARAMLDHADRHPLAQRISATLATASDPPSPARIDRAGISGDVP